MSAGGWAFSGVILAPFAWLLYLDRREKLIAKAQANPVDVKTLQKIGVSVLIAVSAIPESLQLLTVVPVAISQPFLHSI